MRPPTRLKMIQIFALMCKNTLLQLVACNTRRRRRQFSSRFSFHFISFSSPVLLLNLSACTFSLAFAFVSSHCCIFAVASYVCACFFMRSYAHRDNVGMHAWPCYLVLSSFALFVCLWYRFRSLLHFVFLLLSQRALLLSMLLLLVLLMHR